MERDPYWNLFYNVTAEALREAVAPYELLPSVPEEISKHYERSRATFRASYVEHELIVVAAEYAWLTVEPAVRMRLQQSHTDRAAQLEHADLGRMLPDAVSEGLLSPEWDIDRIRLRRNLIAHVKATMTFPAGVTVQTISEVAALINELWSR